MRLSRFALMLGAVAAMSTGALLYTGFSHAAEPISVAIAEASTAPAPSLPDIVFAPLANLFVTALSAILVAAVIAMILIDAVKYAAGLFRKDENDAGPGFDDPFRLPDPGG
jgi:hypothetical protein